MKFQRVLVSLIRCILTILGYIFNPVLDRVFSIIYDQSSTMVSPVHEDILMQSATSLAKKIRSRQVNAVDVMEAFIARVKEVNPVVNAAVSERFEEALKEAQNIDEILDAQSLDPEYSEDKKPFLGVPLTVKEAFAVKGMPNTAGLVIRKNTCAEVDAPVVAYLKQAGAIPFIVTNVSELCMWYESANRLYGRTSNPYHTGKIVGGSSGGEACIIASGGAVIGIGSDIGGSIRMPAFFNGVFGHRSSRGAVPNEGQFPIASGSELELLSTGPICRYAEDLLPALKIMAGKNANNLKFDEMVDLKSLKFYSIEDDGGSLFVSTIDPQLKAAQLKVVTFLEETYRVTVEHVCLSKLKYSLEMWSARMSSSDGTSFCQYMANCNGQVNPYLEFFKWIFRCSNHTLPAIGLGLVEKLDFLLEGSNRKALDTLKRLKKELQDMLGDNGILLYPTHPKLAPYHNQPLFYPLNFAYTAIFNALGLPVTQVPLGLSKEGLPLGIQIVTAINKDHLSIAVARALEGAFGGWVNPGA
ncbi:hypothetical protein CHS0354_017971 [Potamilus streckersoni]|uniref:Amidase domain-containing protein n=1 Tax=Potamilus streckersoni TaxID=2493646 RepID=A0AAE0RWQ0_9BIVA|nr:hypothetical protein CHS0354_017971 [Potamilus streckersoni]